MNPNKIFRSADSCFEKKKNLKFQYYMFRQLRNFVHNIIYILQ